MSTEIVYSPGDGISLDLGDVVVRDLIVIGTEEGAPATVSAYVVNNSAEDATVSFGDAEVSVPAHSAMQVSPAGESGVTLPSLEVAPGAMVPMSVSVDGSPAADVRVPSISPDNPIYADFGG